MTVLKHIAGGRVGNFIREFTGKLSGINQKYANPKIKLSAGAKFALLLLELYLIVLVCLLAYRFWLIIHGDV